MEKIHLENIIKSFFLGLFIGVILQLYGYTEEKFLHKILSALASGGIGFIVGLVTEWLTSKLPVRIANARSYFFLNNIIALAITTCMMAAIIVITGSAFGDYTSMIWIVLGIICAANLFDYAMYRRAQRKLEKFKALLKDK